MPDLLALVGPTASGKTHVAVEVAGDLGAEIVCIDSMTVYRGMDVGTAKPSTEERARVPHHLIDVADPGERFTVARFQALARAALEVIRARERVPLVVGGSGLYVRAVVDDLAFPPEDLAVRARLEAEDASTLAVRLKEEDPKAAAFIDLRNKRRVVRALEVIEVTGRPFSSFRDAWGRHRPAVIAGLEISDQVLEHRVRERLLVMLDEGLLQETERLLAKGFRDALTASQAIGYRQAVGVIEGTLDRQGFIDQATRATARFARRQMAWFRRDPRVRWFDADEVNRAAAEVRAYYREQIERETG